MRHSGTHVGFCSCADQFVSDLFEITKDMLSRQDARIEDRESLVSFNLLQGYIFELLFLSRFKEFIFFKIFNSYILGSKMMTYSGQ